MVETLAPAGYAGRLRTTLVACATFTAGALVGGRDHVRRPRAAGPVARRGRDRRRGRGRGDRGRRGDRRGARHPDRAAGPPPGAGVVAARAAGAAGGRALRRAARPRLHDLHPHVRGVGARGGQRRARRPGARRRARPRVRRRPRAAGDRARAGRRDRPRQRRPRGDGRAPRDPARAARGRRGRARRLRRRDDRRGARRRGDEAGPARVRRPRSRRPPRPGPPPRARTSRSSGRARPARATSAAPTAPSACPVAIPRSAPASSAGAPPRARSCSPTPDTLTPVATYAAPGAGPFAFSDQWVVWLVGNAQLVVQPRDASVAPRTIATARPGEQLGRPSIAGGAVVFHRAGKTGSSIRLFDLVANLEGVHPLRAPRAAQQPDLRRRPPALRPLDLHAPGAPARAARPPQDHARPPRSTAPLRPPAATPATSRATTATHAGYKGRKPPPLAPRPPAGVVDTLWTTALGPGAAYVTRLRKKSGVTSATVLSVPR